MGYAEDWWPVGRGVADALAEHVRVGVRYETEGAGTLVSQQGRLYGARLVA